MTTNVAHSFKRSKGLQKGCNGVNRDNDLVANKRFLGNAYMRIAFMHKVLSIPSLLC